MVFNGGAAGPAAACAAPIDLAPTYLLLAPTYW